MRGTHRGLSVALVHAAAFAVLAGAPAALAAPGEDELRCYSRKLSVASYHAKKIGACHGKLARTGDAALFDACASGVDAAAESKLAIADSRVEDPAFVCAGTPATLSLEGAAGWQRTLAESAIIQSNALPNACVEKRVRAMSRFASKYAACVRRSFDLAPVRLEACAADLLPQLTSAWNNAGQLAPCTSDDASGVAAAAVAAVDAQARLLHVTCGDSSTTGYEECDDGDLDGGDGCDAACIVERCGNAVLQAGEACDDGSASATCDADCTAVACGDGVWNAFAGEGCDDGDLDGGDGCDAACIVERCGNAVLQAGETCDDGAASATCDADCTDVVCGDGLRNTAADEECDDGDLDAGDGCDGACVLEACGDGHREDPEECDDGHLEDGDGCTSLCLREQCGVAAGGSVACLWCPEGSEPDAAFATCVCSNGFQAAGAGCVDVDECAGDPCGAGMPCDNLPGSWSCPIVCTEQAFHAALEACGGASRTITFDCADTTIAIASGANGPRRTTCDGLVVDGLDRNVTFEMTPACFGQVIPAEQCRVALDPDGTCPCPEENSGTVFLSLEGDGMTVRNLTVRHFFDGIKTEGNDNTVENVTFERLCDEAVGSNAGAGNVFAGIEASLGCGKCMQSYGNIGATAADPRLRRHYNAVLRDSVFTDCQQPVRTTEAGRFLVESTRMEGTFASGMFRCLGPRFTSGAGHTQILHFFDSVLDGCDDGLRVGGGVQALVRGNTLVNNEFRGLLATATARVVAWDNVIRGNGGLANSEGGLGGVGVIDAAEVDLGGGALVIDGVQVASPGYNVLCENVSPQGAPREVHNTTAATVSAIDNYWCTTDPQSRVTGSVLTTPFLTDEP